MTFGPSGKGAEAGLFSAYCKAGGPTAAALPFGEEACNVFGVGVLEAEL